MKLSKKLRVEVLINLITGVFTTQIEKVEKDIKDFILSEVVNSHGEDLEWSNTLTDVRKSLVTYQHGFTVSYKDVDDKHTHLRPRVGVELFENPDAGYHDKKLLVSFGHIQEHAGQSYTHRIKTNAGYPCQSPHLYTKCNEKFFGLIAQRDHLERLILATATQVYTALLTVTTKEKAIEMMPDIAQYFPKPEKVKSNLPVPSELYENINNLLKA